MFQKIKASAQKVLRTTIVRGDGKYQSIGTRPGTENKIKRRKGNIKRTKKTKDPISEKAKRATDERPKCERQEGKKVASRC